MDDNLYSHVRPTRDGPASQPSNGPKAERFLGDISVSPDKQPHQPLNGSGANITRPKPKSIGNYILGKDLLEAYLTLL